MKNKLSGIRSLIASVSTLALTSGLAMAQTGSGNAGADSIIAKVEGLVPVAVAVVGAAILVVVVPWGAKMAVRAFKSIGGA